MWFAHPLGEDDSDGPRSYRPFLPPGVHGKVTVGDDELTANYRVEQHVEVVEERDRDRKLLRLLSECHNRRFALGLGGGENRETHHLVMLGLRDFPSSVDFP